MPSVSGPCNVEIGTGGSMITITRDMQFEQAMLSIERLNFELKTQLSDAPDDYRKTGVNVGCAISISDVTNLALVALAFNTTVQGTNPNQYVALSDDAGKAYTRQKIVIKPWAGDTLSTSGNWWTFPSGAAVTSDAFESAFGLTTQRAFSLRLMGLADPTTKVKAYYGVSPV